MTAYPYSGLCARCGKPWQSRSATRRYCDIGCQSLSYSEARKADAELVQAIRPPEDVQGNTARRATATRPYTAL